MFAQSLADRFPKRATSWRLIDRTLEFGKLPLVMGIVNVTPDSFSDGGQFFARDEAVRQSLKLLDDGADILDIGGESTRPYATPVEEEEELRRVIPVVEAVHKARPDAILSIDTSKDSVAKAAIEAGAQIINDISGFEQPAMIAVAKDAAAAVCAMHMQGTPQTMQDNPFYEDVAEDIYSWLLARRDALLTAGIDRDRICLDPGIGFGKTHQHNLALMANCWRFHDLGCPLLVGHSRKGFIGKVLGDKEADRKFGTIGAAMALAAQGVQILRVHDVLAVRQALGLFAACGGIDGSEVQIT
ncbi:MAG TPA: dihydropteroate synthase [Pirellulaceae bacterium]|nr:dihydropteroate synthase [Pirellulaceae bacterium]